MPYYSGDYYQGDNYAAGGLFGSIGKFLGGVAKKALGLTPIGAVASSLIPTFGRPRTPFGPAVGPIPEPGISGMMHRAFPGGASGFLPRRRINPLNIKALRRAMRRAKSFEKQARRVGTYFNPGKTFRLKGRARKR